MPHLLRHECAEDAWYGADGTYQNGNIAVWACFGCGETHEYACGGESQARSKKWQGMQWLFACEQVDELISANRSKNAGDESDCG